MPGNEPCLAFETEKAGEAGPTRVVQDLDTEFALAKEIATRIVVVEKEIGRRLNLCILRSMTEMLINY